MLSEGRPGIDNVFSLCEGLLRLEVDKATFERMGLEGHAIPSGGRKHVKARYGGLINFSKSLKSCWLTLSLAIELNLRPPSMLRGKKGFERIVWAFKNVLNHSVVWLFCDLKGMNDGTGPVSIHQPMVKQATCQTQSHQGVCVPELPRQLEEHQQEDVVEILEWLTMVMSHSPRVKHDDSIDPYLSRYRLTSHADPAKATEASAVQNLVTFHWHGLIHPAFVHRILLATLKASGNDWFALSARAFDGKSYAVLQNKGNTLTWEYTN